MIQSRGASSLLLLLSGFLLHKRVPLQGPISPAGSLAAASVPVKEKSRGQLCET